MKGKSVGRKAESEVLLFYTLAHQPHAGRGGSAQRTFGKDPMRFVGGEDTMQGKSKGNISSKKFGPAEEGRLGGPEKMAKNP